MTTASPVMSADYAHVPRPPPPGSGGLDSIRRQYDYPPPTALSTTINAGYHHSTPGAGQTPSTASSTLSSPFVGYAYNAMTASPDAPSSTTSPIGSGSASLTYDPSTWGQGTTPQPHGPPTWMANSRPRGHGESAPGMCTSVGDRRLGS